MVAETDAPKLEPSLCLRCEIPQDMEYHETFMVLTLGFPEWVLIDMFVSEHQA